MDHWISAFSTQARISEFKSPYITNKQLGMYAMHSYNHRDVGNGDRELLGLAS